LVSAGSANPDVTVPNLATGIKNIDPFQPPVNFYYQSWREVF
jgi:hypothetical protein